MTNVLFPSLEGQKMDELRIQNILRAQDAFKIDIITKVFSKFSIFSYKISELGSITVLVIPDQIIDHSEKCDPQSDQDHFVQKMIFDKFHIGDLFVCHAQLLYA